jgi:hypothetical protein
VHGPRLGLVFALGGHSVRLIDDDAGPLEYAPSLMAITLATLAMKQALRRIGPMEGT